MEKVIINVEVVHCKDGTEFIGASCLGKDLPKSLNTPKGTDFIKYHIRFNGLDSNKLEPGRYEVEYSDIYMDERPEFITKMIVRLTPYTIVKIL